METNSNARIQSAELNLSDKNKYKGHNESLPLQTAGSNVHIPSKKDSSTRPCAIIGPDGVASQYPKFEDYPSRVWPQPHTGGTPYCRPAQVQCFPDHVYPPRNISPRHTFQENMSRFIVPSPTDVKFRNDSHVPGNLSNSNIILPNAVNRSVLSDVKYCEGTVLVSPHSVDILRSQYNKNNDIPSARYDAQAQTIPPYPHGFNVHEIPYSSYSNLYNYPPELQRYPMDYQHQGIQLIKGNQVYQKVPEQSPYIVASDYPSTPYSRASNIRYEPYPSVGDKFVHPRYEYPYKYGTHSAHGAVTKNNEYRKRNVPDVRFYTHLHSNPDFCGKIVNRRNPTNLPHHLADITGHHTDHYSSQDKLYGFNIYEKGSQMPLNTRVVNDTNKIKLDYYNRYRGLPYPEVRYSTENLQSCRGNVPYNYPMKPPDAHHPTSMNIQKPLDTLHSDRSNDPDAINYHKSYYNHKYGSYNPLAKIPTEFSPNIISPTESNTSCESVNTVSHQMFQEDGGYVSQCSTASGQSIDFQFGYPKSSPYDPSTFLQTSSRHPAVQRNHFVSSTSMADCNKAQFKSKNSKSSIDVRQYLEMWDEEYEDVRVKPAVDSAQQKVPDVGAHSVSQHALPATEQLYVLDKVTIASDDLHKYEHIQKITKLPDNIKEYQMGPAHSNIRITEKETVEKNNEIFHKYNVPRENLNFNVHVNCKPDNFKSDIGINELIDVEAKISQSVIHKEVGCNFEIKPCSPGKIVDIPMQVQQNCQVTQVSGEILSSNNQKTKPSKQFNKLDYIPKRAPKNRKKEADFQHCEMTDFTKNHLSQISNQSVSQSLPILSTTCQNDNNKYKQCNAGSLHDSKLTIVHKNSQCQNSVPNDELAEKCSIQDYSLKNNLEFKKESLKCGGDHSEMKISTEIVPIVKDIERDLLKSNSSSPTPNIINYDNETSTETQLPACDIEPEVKINKQCEKKNEEYTSVIISTNDLVSRIVSTQKMKESNEEDPSIMLKSPLGLPKISDDAEEDEIINVDFINKNSNNNNEISIIEHQKNMANSNLPSVILSTNSINDCSNSQAIKTPIEYELLLKEYEESLPLVADKHTDILYNKIDPNIGIIPQTESTDISLVANESLLPIEITSSESVIQELCALKLPVEEKNIQQVKNLSKTENYNEISGEHEIFNNHLENKALHLCADTKLKCSNMHLISKNSGSNYNDKFEENLDESIPPNENSKDVSSIVERNKLHSTISTEHEQKIIDDIVSPNFNGKDVPTIDKENTLHSTISTGQEQKIIDDIIPLNTNGKDVPTIDKENKLHSNLSTVQEQKIIDEIIPLNTNGKNVPTINEGSLFHLTVSTEHKDKIIGENIPPNIPNMDRKDIALIDEGSKLPSTVSIKHEGKFIDASIPSNMNISDVLSTEGNKLDSTNSTEHERRMIRNISPKLIDENKLEFDTDTEKQLSCYSGATHMQDNGLDSVQESEKLDYNGVPRVNCLDAAAGVESAGVQIMDMNEDFHESSDTNVVENDYVNNQNQHEEKSYDPKLNGIHKSDAINIHHENIETDILVKTEFNVEDKLLDISSKQCDEDAFDDNSASEYKDVPYLEEDDSDLCLENDYQDSTELIDINGKMSDNLEDIEDSHLKLEIIDDKILMVENIKSPLIEKHFLESPINSVTHDEMLSQNIEECDSTYNEAISPDMYIKSPDSMILAPEKDIMYQDSAISDILFQNSLDAVPKDDINGLELGGCWIDDIACIETVVSEEVEFQQGEIVDLDSIPQQHTWESNIGNVSDAKSDGSVISQTLTLLTKTDSNSNVILTDTSDTNSDTDSYEKEILHVKNKVQIHKTENTSKSSVPFLKSIQSSTEVNTNVKSTEKRKICKKYDHKDVKVEKYYISSIINKKSNIFDDSIQEKSKNSVNLGSKINSYRSGSCEENSFVNVQCNHFPEGKIMTKGAQKYIPPVSVCDHNLKCHLPLPKKKLVSLSKQNSKKSETKEMTTSPESKSKNRMVLPKINNKPKFEDVLKNIDKHISWSKIKVKKLKSKKAVPKMIIKKDERGSHYASTPPVDTTFSPDMTGNKWQPWVCLQRTECIEEMIKNNISRALCITDTFSSLSNSKSNNNKPKESKRKSRRHSLDKIRIKKYSSTLVSHNSHSQTCHTEDIPQSLSGSASTWKRK